MSTFGGDVHLELPADLPGREAIKIAFVVPLQGPTGIYGPSCLACAGLA